MKLATLKRGGRDGTLVVVSRDNRRFALASDIAPSLQSALDEWDRSESLLLSRFNALQSGEVEGEPLELEDLHAPLPRAYEWVDGSAYLNHVILVRKARGAAPPATLEQDPLVYQGGSGHFLGPREDIELPEQGWGLDFEAELCVVLDDTPKGVGAEGAREHIRLLMLCNDITLRNLIPTELAKNFGFFCSKPATAFSPFALTPDELGEAFDGERIHLPLRTRLNGKEIGCVDAGAQMHFGFPELIEHIARTRQFTAGTIVGSGTVSNSDEQQGSSCLSELRMKETIATGSASTPYMKPGDVVEIEMLDAQNNNLFGTIEQQVKKS